MLDESKNSKKGLKYVNLAQKALG